MRRPAPRSGQVTLFSGPRIALLIGAAVLVYIGLSSSDVLGSCPRLGRRYGVMLDAGSTGSRIHVYDFDYKPNGEVVLVNEVFQELKPGLSSFSDDPRAAATSLRPLMDAAVKAIPDAAAPCTPVELKATAGLRLVGAEKSAKILEAVEHLFRQYNFFVPQENAAIVMDGRDEGPFAWATVNFLLGTITPDAAKHVRTAATIDMGGASTQIVFQPESAVESPVMDDRYTLRLFGRSNRLYQHSHLGYGLKEAGKAMMKRFGASHSFPCFPHDYQDKIVGGDSDGQVISNREGTQSFTECLAVARSILQKDAACAKTPCSFNGVWQPSLARDFRGPIYAFSYFYDRMETWLPETGVVTLARFREVGERICSSRDASDTEFGQHNKGTMCLDFAYLYSILSTGFDLPDATELHIMKKINGIETAWSLGAMLAVLK